MQKKAQHLRESHDPLNHSTLRARVLNSDTGASTIGVSLHGDKQVFDV